MEYVKISQESFDRLMRLVELAASPVPTIEYDEKPKSGVRVVESWPSCLADDGAKLYKKGEFLEKDGRYWLKGVNDSGECEFGMAKLRASCVIHAWDFAYGPIEIPAIIKEA